LLMAAAECPLGGWQNSLPAAPALRVRWRGGRAYGLFAAGVAFVLVGLLFPQRLIGQSRARTLDMGKEMDKLAAQIDVLKQAAGLEPARAETLKQKLNQLKDEASGENPVKTLEAFDHLQNLANQAAKESAEEAVRKTEQLAKTEALAEALRQGAGAGDDKF